jgi:hypothetical protein
MRVSSWGRAKNRDCVARIATAGWFKNMEVWIDFIGVLSSATAAPAITASSTESMHCIKRQKLSSITP